MEGRKATTAYRILNNKTKQYSLPMNRHQHNDSNPDPATRPGVPHQGPVPAGGDSVRALHQLDLH